MKYIRKQAILSFCSAIDTVFYGFQSINSTCYDCLLSMFNAKIVCNIYCTAIPKNISHTFRYRRSLFKSASLIQFSNKLPPITSNAVAQLIELISENTWHFDMT